MKRKTYSISLGLPALSAVGLAVGLAAGAACLTEGPAQAQSTQQGFTLNRYEPTAAGEWSFWVDHPWYSSTRYFAAGITLNYGHNPLVYVHDLGDKLDRTTNVIEHQLLGHVDLAGSFLDRILISATLPVTLLERGTATAGVTPTEGVVVGDPRLGLWIRLFGQPYRSAVALSIGANVWIPLRAFTDSGVSSTSSDSFVRVMPKLALGGLAHNVMWSLTGGFLYRAPAQIGSADPRGSTVGSELQFGAAIAYANLERRFVIGPEAVLSTTILGNDEVQPRPFTSDYTSLEVLLGLHYNIAKLINLGLAGGLGVLRTPGTPDGRALLRLAYAPLTEPQRDRDHDGILDSADACPDTWGIATQDPRTHGCPDRDQDKVPDAADLCPDTPKGEHPDAARLGCPLGDRDHDGVLDPDDLCPSEPMGELPDAARRGCPLGDRDHDQVPDRDDLCPDQHKGKTPDPARLGCPIMDRDGDGVLDPDDLCPDEPMGTQPDATRLGCPLHDRDGDKVPDGEDACPDTAGVASANPKLNGCPLSEVKDGKIIIVAPVFFATDKDVILQESNPVLQSVADTLQKSLEIKKILIEGHTDNRGSRNYNIGLSTRRAKSVMNWLIESGGVSPSRLQAKGFGPDRPIANNNVPEGRERNRRVEFVILDPPQAANVKTVGAKDVAVPSSPDQSDTSPGSQPAGKRSTVPPKKK